METRGKGDGRVPSLTGRSHVLKNTSSPTIAAQVVLTSHRSSGYSGELLLFANVRASASLDMTAMTLMSPASRRLSIELRRRKASEERRNPASSLSTPTEQWLSSLSRLETVLKTRQGRVKVQTISSLFKSINQSINIFNVLGANWDPIDKKFSSVNSYRQDLLPTCKAFPKETTTCIWFTQNHKVCNILLLYSTTVLQEVQML